MKLKYIGFLLVVLLCGCANETAGNFTNEVIPSMNQSNTLVNEGDIEVSDPENPMNDESHLTALNTIYDLENKDAFEIIKMNESLYLVGVMEQYTHFFNYRYHIYDFETNTSNSVEFLEQLIEDITFYENQIVFKGDGSNHINGFRDFPKNYTYDLNTNKMIAEENYKLLGSVHDHIFLGGAHNATAIEILEHESDAIVFDFNQHESSILAGGNFAPSIQVSSNEESLLVLDFKNVYYDSNQFEYHVVNNIITKVDIEEYTGIDNKNHTIMRFSLNEKFKEYSCEFILGDDGYYNLHIRFK